MLIEYFVQGYATRAGKYFQSINKKTLELFHSCDWPENMCKFQKLNRAGRDSKLWWVFSVNGSYKELLMRAPRVQSPAP